MNRSNKADEADGADEAKRSLQGWGAAPFAVARLSMRDAPFRSKPGLAERQYPPNPSHPRSNVRVARHAVGIEAGQDE